jgi:hypothetical protein
MSKARLDLEIELRRHCDRSAERYHDSVGRACLPKQMCNVVLYARKKAEFYKNNNPDLSKKWEAEAKYYEEQNNNEQPGAFPSSCDAAKVGATRKTRGGGGLRLFTRRHNPPPRPHTSYVGYANKSPLEGPHRPIPTEWMKKHRASMSNPKKGGRRTRRRGARASRKRPTR